MKINPFAPIKELQTALKEKKILRKELLEYCIARFKDYDHKIGSALEIFDKESILSRACAEGVLAGIPGIVKDVIAQKGRCLSCASKILEPFVSPYDATATARLKKDGALLIGRANLDEFAMGSSNETSAFYKVANPWDITRVSGGSSGGSAAAVAAGFVPWSLGSDTGGSVRLPAAFCGVVGIKPTYGLISRCGLVAYASSLDQIGIITRTIYDNALVMSAIAGHDLKDSTTCFVEKKDYTQKLDGSIKKGLRIGVIDNGLQVASMNPEIVAAIEEAVKVLEKLGATIKHFTLSAIEYSAATYFIISRAEAASNLARYDGVRYGMRVKSAESLTAMYEKTRYDGFGQEVRRRIMIGNYTLSVGHHAEFYGNAKKVQQMIRNELEQTFKEVDLLVMPTHSIPAFKFGTFDDNKLAMDLQDYFTCPANLAGIPAISIPCGFTKDTIPIGFQLIGPSLSEELLYQTAHAYEQQTPWHTMHPKKF
ncbi:Asp-tRNA(Asn)/Glu-tRNA(Gln) amidotransferase subunit GatA [Candidatus Dependentiae bacterium]|nr:MAG: Asp-tRNA(Asn)/Glu-tRNA(Gln) amidotransferase subunit GatA [Candidatus Dependentiae bacterium]